MSEVKECWSQGMRIWQKHHDQVSSSACELGTAHTGPQDSLHATCVFKATQGMWRATQIQSLQKQFPTNGPMIPSVSLAGGILCEAPRHMIR